MSGRVVLADKRLRLTTLCAATLVAVLGLIGLSGLTSYLDSLTVLQRTDPQRAAEHYAHLLLLIALSTVLVACAAGGALSFLCWQVLRARQFPPPGIPLLWNTQVRTGSQARRLAIVGLVLAVALTVGGIGLGVVMVCLSDARGFSRPSHASTRNGAGQR